MEYWREDLYVVGILAVMDIGFVTFGYEVEESHVKEVLGLIDVDNVVSLTRVGGFCIVVLARDNHIVIGDVENAVCCVLCIIPVDSVIFCVL